MVAHTGGPWIVDRTFRSGQWGVVAFVKGDIYRRIARCGSPRVYRSPEADAEDEANARLIAAAPNMLAALDHVEAVLSIAEPLSHKAEYMETLAEVQAVLRKAREPQA